MAVALPAEDLQLADGMAFSWLRLWSMDHLRTEKGEVLTFADQPWLEQIWDDPHPRIDWKKSVQIGASTWAWMYALYLTAMQGLTVIYTMPTAGDIGDFVRGRLDPAIDYSALMRQVTGRAGRRGWGKAPSDQVGLKAIGRGHLYLRGTVASAGSEVTTQALSVPADALIQDEVDASDDKTLRAYESRLERVDPAKRRRYRLSTPTSPGVGIDALYAESTGNAWMVSCAGCGWRGELEYWRHTDGKKTQLHCAECSTVLDPRNGEWIAARPDRDVHGYSTSKLLLCLPDRPDILTAIHAQREDPLWGEFFDNMILGQARSVGESEVDTEAIKSVAWQAGVQFQEAGELFGTYFMGVDQGNTLTVVIVQLDYNNPNWLRVVYLGQLRDPAGGAWVEVDRLVNAFGITLGVFDSGPEHSRVHELAERYPGRVLACHYGEDMGVEMRVSGDVAERASGEVWGEIDPREHTDITVDRTMTLDGTAGDLKRGTFQFPGSPLDDRNQEALKHFKNNVRAHVVNAKGKKVVRWERRGGYNDFFHGFNYVRIAVRLGRRLAVTSPPLLNPALSFGVEQPR